MIYDQMTMSTFISSPTQNLFKFATWFYYITFFYNFLHFCCALSLILLLKCGLGKCYDF